MQNGIDSEKLLDALDSVTWYNGLAEQVLEWKKIPVEPTIDGKPQIKHLYSSLDGEQLEVIWMIAVSLFGDYGTSPRSGWITDVKGFYEFVDRITELYRGECAIRETENGEWHERNRRFETISKAPCGRRGPRFILTGKG